MHNFHLKGPGVNKQITSVAFVGTKTVTVKLTKGKYTYVCDPHATIPSMKGTFTVK
jgi:plastocyanin